MKILLSFVGNNDCHPFENPGAILSILGQRPFDLLYLLINAEKYLKPANEIIQYCRQHFPHLSVEIERSLSENPADYNTVYPAMYQAVKSILSQSENAEYWISLTSGTPVMHACWIFLQQGGVIDAKLIQISRSAEILDVTFELDDFPEIRQAEAVKAEMTRLYRENKSLKRIAGLTSNGIVGQSLAILTIKEQIDRFADTNIPIFVSGESGTGKELVAEAIHYGSSRKDKPFIVDSGKFTPVGGSTETSDVRIVSATHKDIRSEEKNRIKEEERKKIIADLSHSIKNLISTVIDPLENLKQEDSVKPQVIENALRGANLIREIVNAVNLSFKGSIDDFRYDAGHNTDSDSQDIKTIIIEAFKHSVGNMFDGKYFGTFMRNYFPEKPLYVAAKSEWSTLSQLGDLDRLRPFIERYFFRTDFDLDHAEQFIIGNQKGSIIKLMILFQEMILNAVKYSAFIDRENRFLKIRFTASEQSVSILVENPFDTQTKVKTSGIGHVIIENFAQLLGTTPEIKNDDAIYSVQIRFNNIWKETDK